MSLISNSIVLKTKKINFVMFFNQLCGFGVTSLMTSFLVTCNNSTEKKGMESQQNSGY